MDAALPSPQVMPLLGLPRGRWGRVVGVDVPETERRWLAAVGLSLGTRVEVRRQGVLGGPLHVHTDAGGAFAVGAALARCIRVEADPS